MIGNINNIKADELVDGSAISTILIDMGNSLIAVLLSIIATAFEMGFNWLIGAIALTALGDNPAIFLIGLALILTAFFIWRK